MRLARIPSIGANGRQKEKRAQNVLAFGDPGYRLHVDWVQRKQHCHEQARSDAAGCECQQQKQQHGTRRVNQQVGEVMSGWVLVKQAVVQGMGKPG